MTFLLIHGAYGNPSENWFPDIKNKMEKLGQKVISPEFPVDNWDEITKKGPNILPERQSLNSWMEVFDDVYKTFKKGEKLCFVGHSLGCVFILHAVNKYNLKLDSAIFTSPFLTKLNKDWQIDLVNKSFYKKDFDFEKLKQLIPFSFAIYSDNDPYVEQKFFREFGMKMGSKSVVIEGGGHLNSEAGFSSFPLVFKLCRSRI